MGGGGGGLLCMFMLAPPFHSQNSPFFVNVTPKQAQAWSVPQVGVREALSGAPIP